jgi:TolA-binding protein
MERTDVTGRLEQAIATLLLLALAVLPLRGQETVATIRETAFRRFTSGEFAEALPYLEQLIEIQGNSKSSQIQAGMERVFYNAAMCQFLTGQFAGAEAAFVRYNKKYRRGIYLHESFVYIADAQRFSGRLSQAIKSYEAALRRFSYPVDLRTDIYAAIARCHLAEGDWVRAREPLRKAFETAPDFLRRNRAATLLATAYLKTLELDQIYLMVPYLLTRDSLASRSIAFNLAALEAGDDLFGEERYREAFWIHRLVYPHDEVLLRTELFLEQLQRMVLEAQRDTPAPRRLMRLQEWVADTEAELQALRDQVDNYDPELMYRIARGYMEAKRYREGCELFLHLNRVGGEAHAEESLYLAFVCAANVTPLTRAYAIARQYMDDYPGGEWYDPLTLTVGQMYAREPDWPETIRHFSEVLQVKPGHQAAAECLYLLGYAHFMEEQFEQARVRLLDLRTRFPESDLMDDALYWSAMSAMFDGDFETGAQEFEELLLRFPETLYAIDAAYRLAVCNYALGDYDRAEQRLATFMLKHPGHALAGEARMTRGDIAGAVGRVDDAIRHYQSAMNASTNDLNIEQFNHCAFQAGQILYDHERYANLREHFQRYLEQNREGSNPPLAIYWIGRAMWQMEERMGTVRFYRDAALKFGRDRLAIGVDMILDEWVAATRKLTPDESAVAWKDIELTIRAARDSGDRVAMLRFQRLLLYHPDLQPAARERLLDNLCTSSNIPHASPSVLETMLTTARARNQDALAVRVARAVIDDFTETDYALDARMYLAQRAIGLARSEPPGSTKAQTLFDEAASHLQIIRDVYAASGEAAEALLALGEIYTLQNKTDEADQCYKDVLGFRDWRNLWPRALLGRGQCAEAKREWIRASAFYERIYVLYIGYREIAAQAYYKRAECLHRGYEDAKAIETLQAMLGNQDFAAFPEFEKARQLLARLGGTR